MNPSLLRTRVRLLVGASGAVILSVLAAACSSGSSSSATSAAAPANSSPSTSAAAAPVPIVLYSAQGYDSTVANAFTKATGIPVKIDADSTGALLTQIYASENNPNWTLLWVDGATAYAELDTKGLLLKNSVPTEPWNSLGTESQPADKSYTPTGVTLMGAIVYDTTKITSPPTTWQQLTTAPYRDAVGMNDPSQSGPAFPLIAGVMNYLGSVSAGESYFSRLRANGLVVHATSGPTLQALANGQIKLAITQSSVAEGAKLGGKNLGVGFLSPATLLSSNLAIDAKASPEQQAEAEKFIAFTLSPAGQQAMQSGDPTGDSLYYPVVNGVSPLPALPSLASVKTQVLDPYKWGPQEATINNWFDQNIVR